MKRYALFLGLTLTLAGMAYGSGIKPGQYTFTYFKIPNNHNLGADAINDFGSIAGYYAIPQGAFQRFLRTPDGNVTTLIDPGDQGGSTSGFTEAYDINIEGIVVGQFYDTAAAQNSGFLYQNGNFTTYNVPGLPAHSTTAIGGINDLGDFCGTYSPAPNFPYINAFLNQRGNVTEFSYAGSSNTQAEAINDFGQSGGYYFDSSGVVHGFFRDFSGELSDITVPGASTTPGYGTVLFGINNVGWMSGHFWDASNNEHGFVRAPSGQFYQIDVPGAQQTSGGHLNDEGVMVGHYIDSQGNWIGYIATPKR